MRRTTKRAEKEAAGVPALAPALPFPGDLAGEVRRAGHHWGQLNGHDFAPADAEPVEELADPDEPAPVAEEETSGPDDALGLYLRQMGAIPLLNREQELALAERLEFRRRRYRRAALSNWRTLAAVLDNFERVRAAKL